MIPCLAPGSPAARMRKPAVGVAIMMSDTRGLWHADMIRSAGSAASRDKIRHRRPWPRTDQVALGINRRWQESSTWLARVGASSIASRYSLWIRGITSAWQQAVHQGPERHECSQELAKLRGDEANTLVKEVKVDGQSGLENLDVSMRNTATEESSSSSLKLELRRKRRKLLCVTTSTQRPKSSISTRQPAA